MFGSEERRNHVRNEGKYRSEGESKQDIGVDEKWHN
jgi:hypothetical protein